MQRYLDRHRSKAPLSREPNEQSQLVGKLSAWKGKVH
jgi:hypothetical protein